MATRDCAEVEALVQAFDANDPHDVHVEGLSKQVFGFTAGIHGLPETYEPILAAGARLSNVGLSQGRKKHQLRGREMILAEVGDEPSTAAKMAALMAGYHRKKVKTDGDPLLADLTDEERDAALKLCAIVRVADALDYTRDQQTTLVDVEQTLGACTLLAASTNGDGAINVARGTKQADLWNSLLPVPLVVEDLSAHEKAQRRPVLMAPTDTMAEAGRKVLLHHLRKCLSHENGTRQGENIDELHDMRVATRRMRSAFRTFGKHMAPEEMDRFLDELRWLASALGEVRDRDVFIEFLEGYAGRAPEGDRPALNRLLGHRRRQRTRYRKQLVEVLDSDRYRHFAVDFEAFLNDPARVAPPAGAALQPVLKAAPEVIRRRFKKVCAYRKRAPYADGADLHKLRIQCKRLRYAVEFFDPCFDGALKTLIEQCVKIQDTLGNVHDADVYTEFLESHAERLLSDGDAKEDERAAIERLVKDIARWRKESLAGFWAVWPKVAGKKKAVSKWRGLLDALEAGQPPA